MSHATYFFSGAAFLGLLAAGLIFLRFWHRSHDRLFAAFAISFFMMSLERLLVLRFTPDHEAHAMIYLIRLFAFVIIMAAVAEKNRVNRPVRGTLAEQG